MSLKRRVLNYKKKLVIDLNKISNSYELDGAKVSISKDAFYWLVYGMHEVTLENLEFRKALKD